MRETLKRLIDEATAVAPSIRHFDVDRAYGRVTDEDLDTAGQIRFEIEADTVLAALARTGDARYEALCRRHEGNKRKAERFHSKSILVRETQQLLKAALGLLDTQPSKISQGAHARAIRLLAAVRDKTETTAQPVFVLELAPACQLTADEAQAAWRYLRDHSLIDIFNIPYTARVNAKGVAVLDGRPQLDSEGERVVTEAAIDPPPSAEKAVLCYVWRASVDLGDAIDAPSFLDDHRAWSLHVEALETQRYLAREGDRLRLTARGLLCLDDDDAREAVRLADHIHGVLHASFKNPATRGTSILLDALARTVGAERRWLTFVLEHLRDALTMWCASYTPVFTQPEAFFQPSPGVMKWRSIRDVAVQLQTFAAEYGPGNHVAPSVQPHIRARHAIVLIHGIRTQAEWQQAAIEALESCRHFQVFPFRYEFFDLVRFLVPLNFFRNGAVKRVERLIHDALSLEGIDGLSVICHSFGTWILSRILEQFTEIRFSRIILCGSVIPDRFQWDRYKAQIGDSPHGHGYVVNDCGMHDIWPVLAMSITSGYGSSGRFGFGHPRVVDRFHNIGHSDFLKREFIETYWLPFLERGEVVPGVRDRAPTSWWISALTRAKIKYFAVVALGLSALLLLPHSFSPWVNPDTRSAESPPGVIPKSDDLGSTLLHRIYPGFDQGLDCTDLATVSPAYSEVARVAPAAEVCYDDTCTGSNGCAQCATLSVYLNKNAVVGHIHYLSTADAARDTPAPREVPPGDLAWSMMEIGQEFTRSKCKVVTATFHNRSENRSRSARIAVDWKPGPER